MLSSTGAATEGLPEVAASANERNFESGLVKVMLFISHGQDFTFPSWVQGLCEKICPPKHF